LQKRKRERESRKRDRNEILYSISDESSITKTSKDDVVDAASRAES
jgi:hypothetical protein